MPPSDSDCVEQWEQFEGGVRIKIRCPQCGTRSTVTIQASDPEGTVYPLECGCAGGIHLVSGSSMAGKGLLEALKLAAERLILSTSIMFMTSITGGPPESIGTIAYTQSILPG